MPTEPVSKSFELMILLPALLGVAGGGISNLFIRIWQYGHDSWGNLVDSICENLDSLGDIGTEYWCSAGEELREDAIREAKILGLQTRIDGLMGDFYARVHPSRHNLHIVFQSKVRDAATGGKFQSSPVPDKSAALVLQSAVSDMIIHVSSEKIRVPAEKMNNWLVVIFTISISMIALSPFFFN